MSERTSIGQAIPCTQTAKHPQSLTRVAIAGYFALPFLDLLLAAQTTLRAHFPANQIQTSTLASIKTGNCPEDCGYCAQSGHFRAQTGLAAQKKLPVAQVVAAAQHAKANGASRFCMGAAWRHLAAADEPYVIELIHAIRALGLETCMTLGMLTDAQAERLAAAGLDYYNHNLDTSRRYYAEVTSTRAYDERIATLHHVTTAGIKVCTGSIVGMAESLDDRIDWLYELTQLPTPPDSIPINLLVPIKGTPLGDKVLAEGELPVIEWIRTIAVTRLCFPTSHVRLAAGRERLTPAEQALAFMAGANSLFYGEKLLTTANASQQSDDHLLASLGITTLVLAP